MPDFRKDSWDGYIVLLLDEFSCLYQGKDNVVADLGFSIDDAIVEDVWAKSNGLVAQFGWCIVTKISS